MFKSGFLRCDTQHDAETYLKYHLNFNLHPIHKRDQLILTEISIVQVNPCTIETARQNCAWKLAEISEAKSALKQQQKQLVLEEKKFQVSAAAVYATLIAEEQTKITQQREEYFSTNTLRFMQVTTIKPFTNSHGIVTIRTDNNSETTLDLQVFLSAGMTHIGKTVMILLGHLNYNKMFPEIHRSVPGDWYLLDMARYWNVNNGCQSTLAIKCAEDMLKILTSHLPAHIPMVVIEMLIFPYLTLIPHIGQDLTNYLQIGDFCPMLVRRLPSFDVWCREIMYDKDKWVHPTLQGYLVRMSEIRTEIVTLKSNAEFTG